MFTSTSGPRRQRPLRPIAPAVKTLVLDNRGKLFPTANLVYTTTGNEHYIHSRLKSILPSGPKEAAQAYTGISTGNSIRRMASVNAEARTKLVYSSDYGSGQKSSTTSLNGHDAGDRVFPTSSSDDSINGQVHNGTSHEGVLPASTSPSKLSYQSAPTTSPTHIQMKDSYVQVVDVRKAQQRKIGEASSLSPPNGTASHQLTSSPLINKPPVRRVNKPKSNTYIQRIAAVNARACVHAIMGYEYLTKKRETELRNVLCIGESSESDSILGKRSPSEQPGNSNQNNSKKKNLRSTNNTKQTATSSVMQPGPAVGSTGSSHESSLQSASQDSDVESVSSSNDDHEELPSSGRYYSFESSQDPPYNCLGLLYNSDTIHSRSFTYFTTEGHLPPLFIPPIVPKRCYEAHNLRSRILEKPISKKRPRKGDNGWTVIGDPVKSIEIRHKGGGKHERKYFIGIQRKDERVFVRDSITVRSGHKKSDVPYVAKVGSIWQESDGINLTVFWYYRPDDVEQHIAVLFYPTELMASQHHDDIGVACIDGKSKVLGFTEYCRYRANEERINSGRPQRSIVPSFNSESDTDGMYHASKKHHLEVEDAEEDDDDDSNVYFCYRAFNHITGKVLKSFT
ncbi:PREDICTED: uncharacterized protein LOC100637584 [Amphimedon queenslandica]|uniref:BAH domain-containing protein n=1 Tax=Amphimedon queenslandica TaxID=400682 RepID=A0A1X7UY04_AMPQE|nr:PREDICTED: uncharacterized protein LOC100637584 [Amphimedon queenslandica]XP_019851546.1 PREDICTED: uncharacterized protein LOC100637584 [Amphimedon queenslandica]|eukprot:XP_003386348.2 PREDICTED: uncharacterized protein LOC100637584 [Amphimedon queenslandica]